MKRPDFNLALTATTVLLAALLWFATFHLQWGVFWFKISASALLLAAISLLFQPVGDIGFSLRGRDILAGALSAIALYLIFWTGKAASTAVLPFAGEQIDAVYGKGAGTPRWLIVLLLLFVTGPCEEIYWRGCLQRQLMRRFGGLRGWLLASAIYGGVHISSGNFMLTAAAVVAGAFWGAIYWQNRSLTTVIISHSLWSAVIFVVMPM